MLRIVLEWFALLLAPMAVYLVYSVGLMRTHPTVKDALRGAPLVLLFFAGVVLVFLALILARSKEEASAGKVYTPPSYKDGKIIPGQIR
jgi:hypothetical protein